MPYGKSQLRRPCYTDGKHYRGARQGCCKKGRRNREPTGHGEEVDLNRVSVLDDEVDECYAEHRRHRDRGPRSAYPSVAYAALVRTRQAGLTFSALSRC